MAWVKDKAVNPTKQLVLKGRGVSKSSEFKQSGTRRCGYIMGPHSTRFKCSKLFNSYPIGSMYAIYGNIYHHYTPNVSIYTIHGSYMILWVCVGLKSWVTEHDPES